MACVSIFLSHFPLLNVFREIIRMCFPSNCHWTIYNEFNFRRNWCKNNVLKSDIDLNLLNIFVVVRVEFCVFLSEACDPGEIFSAVSVGIEKKSLFFSKNLFRPGRWEKIISE